MLPLRLLALLLAGILGMSPPALAQGCPDCATVTLSEPSGKALRAALKATRQGETLLLPPGDYGWLGLEAGDVPGAQEGFPVTIRSADPEKPARLGGMSLNGVAHLRLEGLLLKYEWKDGQDQRFKAFSIVEGRDITLTRSRIVGDINRSGRNGIKDLPTGYGLWVRFGTNIEISGNEFTTWLRGLIVGSSSDIRIIGNNVHTMRSDGMNFAAVQRVRIENNHIHDFLRASVSKDHADMIQFWTNGTKRPSTDIVIRQNILNAANGLFTQSIFMRNEEVDRGRAGSKMFYRNILIEENVILNAHLHGITLGEAEDVVIRKNTIVQQPGAAAGAIKKGLWIPRINMKAASRRVLIENNILHDISGETKAEGWRVRNNIFVQFENPLAPGYYDKVFVAARTGDPAVLSSFAYLPGGPADGTGIGASRLRLEAFADRLTPLVRVGRDPADPAVFTFDAGFSQASGGPDGLQYSWNFGDGSTGEGRAVEHRFANPGRYGVILTLRDPEGQSATAEARVGVQGSEMLSFDPATGQVSSWSMGDATMRTQIKAQQLPDGSFVLPVGQQKKPPSLGPGVTSRLSGSEGFELVMRLRARGNDAAGEILRIHSILSLSIGARGNAQMRLRTTETPREVTLTTASLGLTRGDWHDIVLRYDGQAGVAQLLVDGVPHAQTRIRGRIPGTGRWGLTFGNPFGKKTFIGEIAVLEFRVGEPVSVADN